ncbi:MAG: DUF5590 domain-containing protein [Bacillota bacterium]
MKKWIIISIVILLASSVGLISVYLNATKPLRIAEKKAIEIAKQETNLTDFHDFQLSNGESTYFVLRAKNPNEEEVYVWISEADGKALIKKVSSGVTEEEAVQTVYSNKDPKEIISVRLGMTKIQKTTRPAWEIYYRTDNGRLNYYYVDFETGEKLRAIDNF